MKKIVLFISLTVLIASCSGGGGGVSSLDKLPRMTNPVITSAASSGAVKFTTSSAKVSSASTGIALWDAKESSFSHGDSRGMCEMINLSKESLDRAAQADKILCYIQNTIIAPNNAGAFTGDPYDGNYHVVTLNFGGNNPNPNYADNTAPKMKFKVVKNGDKITEFEMFMCMAGTTASPLQDQYLHEVIDADNNVTIVSKEAGPASWKSHLNVSGKINGESQFTQKTITAVSGGSGGDCTNNQKAIFDQYSDSMQISAYQKGSCSCEGCGTYSNQAFSIVQLINGTSTDIHTLAIGDGSLKVLFGGQGAGSSTESWNGDTRKDLPDWTTGTYYADVNAGSYPTTDPTAEVAAIAFETSEKWDNCAGSSEGTLNVDMDSLDPICSALGLRHDDGSDSWINCWDIIEQVH